MEGIFSTFASALDPLEANSAITEALVFAAWQKVAGRQLSERAMPVGLRGKKLTVNVDDEAWLLNIKGFSPQLIAGINRLVGQGTVEFIEYRCDPAGNRIASRTTEQKGWTADLSALSPSLIKAAEAIADPESRKLFLEAAATNLGRRAA